MAPGLWRSGADEGDSIERALASSPPDPDLLAAASRARARVRRCGVEGLTAGLGGSLARDLAVRRDRRRRCAARPGAAAGSRRPRRAERPRDRYALLVATAAAGVAVPRPVLLLEPADGLGNGFVMERIEGETIPRRILRDPEYEVGPDRSSPAQCGTIAAAIHATDTAIACRSCRCSARPRSSISTASLLDTLGEPHPALELGLRWLGERLPPPPPAPRLVHGDFRNGNLVVGRDGVRAVLDWELSHLGDPVEDLGWLCVRSWRFGVDDHVVGGFGHLDALLDALPSGERRRARSRGRALLDDLRDAEVGGDDGAPGVRAPARRGALGRARDAGTPGRRDGVGPARRRSTGDGDARRPPDRRRARRRGDRVPRTRPATVVGRPARLPHAGRGRTRCESSDREMELGPELDAARRAGLRELLGGDASERREHARPRGRSWPDGSATGRSTTADPSWWRISARHCGCSSTSCIPATRGRRLPGA